MQSEATCKTSYIIIYIRQQKSIFTEERIFDVEELVEEFLGWKNSWKNFWGGRTCGRIFGVEELVEEFLGWKNLWKNFAVEEFVEEFCRGRILRWENFGNHHIGNNIFADKNSADWNVEPNC